MDYHRTWENYATAKSLIITKHLKEDGVVILNADDKSYNFLKDLNADHLSYSIKSPTDLYAKYISEKEDGLRFEICHGEDCIDVFMPILGKYNISNFLAAAGVSINLGLPLEQISETVKDFVTVKGRMEILQRKPFWVIVDYAHTPNAIKEALESARNLLGDTGRIIHVFGSAGHRDFYKRPMMGAMSNEYADITILTAEDSRLESLEEINDSIEKGWRDNGKEGELIRFDYTDKDVEVRRDAIKKALEIALPGDMVIITGKAHETSLCFGQTEYPWNDIEETKTLL
jgi:UDP-N-acetylmuramoyl-L-alanyl-D-glutamate--2,6-diaminopimelate ligase